METSAVQTRKRLRRVVLPLIVAIVVFVFQLSGQFGAGLGYGLLLVSVITLSGSLLALLLLLLTKKFSTEALSHATRWLFWLGAWFYVIGVFALSGYFISEALAGQVELQWIFFGPAAIITLILFDIGIYRLVVQKNKPTWTRYREVISREHMQPDRMRKVLLHDVVFHTSLFSQSGLRWLRHTLILWGFVLMFIVEIFAVFVREGFPAFGFPDIWEISDHPVRLAFDFAFDFFGFLVLVGCLLSFLWRIKASGTEEKKYSDTPSAVFLFLVVISGFFVEAVRLIQDGIPPGSGISFVGWFLASMMSSGGATYNGVCIPLWYFHVFGSLAFIVYVPAHRLAHSCATPIGRLMNSQTNLLAKKRIRSIKGLMRNANQSIVTKVEMDT